MTNYSQVLELDEITLEDCMNLFKYGKTTLIEDGRITNILEWLQQEIATMGSMLMLMRLKVL